METYYEEQGITNSLLDEKNDLLEEFGLNAKKGKEGSEGLAEGSNDEAKELKGLIELKQEEIKLAQEKVEQSDLKGLPSANRELKALQAQLKALKELGVEKSKPKKELTQDQIDARLALEKKANEFSIKFTEETSNKRLQILIKEAQTAYDESVRLNAKRIEKEDGQNSLRISLIKDDIEREKELLIVSYNDKFALAEGNAELEKQLAQRLADDLVAIDKKRTDKEALNAKKLNATKVDLASQGFGALADLVSSFEAKDKESAKRQFKVNKALQIGQTIASTASGIMQQLAVPQDALTGMNFVKAGIVATTGVASLAKIASAKFDGGGGSSDAPEIASSGGSQAPNFNVVGNSGINQIAQLQNEPMRAYVVSGEVTSQQALDRNREMNATL